MQLHSIHTIRCGKYECQDDDQCCQTYIIRTIWPLWKSGLISDSAFHVVIIIPRIRIQHQRRMFIWPNMFFVFLIICMQDKHNQRKIFYSVLFVFVYNYLFGVLRSILKDILLIRWRAALWQEETGINPRPCAGLLPHLNTHSRPETKSALRLRTELPRPLFCHNCNTFKPIRQLALLITMLYVKYWKPQSQDRKKNHGSWIFIASVGWVTGLWLLFADLVEFFVKVKFVS